MNSYQKISETAGLVVFDLDGVHVKEKSSWISMHEHFGTKDKARENLGELLEYL